MIIGINGYAGSCMQSVSYTGKTNNRVKTKLK